MSDTPQGPDWWQASDDKWYPPPRPDISGEGYPAAPPTAPVGQAGPQFGGPGAPQSPYGGVPSMGPPGGGGQNRTPLFVTLGVLLAAALVVLIVAVAGGGDDDDDGQTVSQREPTTEPDDDPPSTEDNTTDNTTDTTEEDDDEPGGGGSTSVDALEVIEEGFSTYPESFGDALTGSYGFIIENTSDEVVAGASISVTILDDSGGIMTTKSGDIGALQPGERLGIGGDLFGDTLTGDISDLEIQFGEASFPSDLTDGQLTVSNVSSTSDDYSTTVTFSVESTFEEQLDYPACFAIFRDAAGAIIGGASGSVDFIPPAGTQSGDISSFDPIPDVDAAEVTCNPDAFWL